MSERRLGSRGMVSAPHDESARTGLPGNDRLFQLHLNHCLEIPTDDGVRSVLDAADADAGVESPFAEHGPPDGAADEAVAVRQKGRVLLLDDDPSFREIIRDFLTEGGYEVIPVKSGVEGIGEILAGDFQVVLCDVMMPGLAGDMFFRAVQRIRPHLCARFIFMTGHRGAGKANDFIESVNGYVLRKPFQLKDLEDSMALAEVRGEYESAFVPAAVDPFLALPAGTFEGAAAPGLPPSGRGPKRREPLPSPPGPKPEAGSPLESIPDGRSILRRALDWRAHGALITSLALFAVLAGMYGVWYPRARHADEVSTAEVRRLAREWAKASVQLEEAQKVRPRLQASLEEARRVREEFDSTKWTPVLRSIAASTGTGIELRTIHTQEKPGESQAFLLRIDGTATGTDSRATADEFLQTLQRDLARDFQVTETPSFEQLDDETGPQPTAPGRQRAIFTITAQIGPAILHKPEGLPGI